MVLHQTCVQELMLKRLRGLVMEKRLIFSESSEVEIETLRGALKEINILRYNKGKRIHFHAEHVNIVKTILFCEKIYEILVLSVNVIERGIHQNGLY